MKKTTTINGDVYTYGRFEPIYNYKRDIYDLYDRPSYEKVQTFEDEDGNWHTIKITRDFNWTLD